MSSWKQHLMFGGLTYPIILTFFLYTVRGRISVFTIVFYALLGLITTLLGSLFPDIDHKQGKLPETIITIGLIIGTFGMLGSIFLMNDIIFRLMQLSIGVCILTKLAQGLKHRGVTHTIWFPLIIILPLLFSREVTTFNSWLLFTFYFGCITHLLLDKVPCKISPKPSNGWW